MTQALYNNGRPLLAAGRSLGYRPLSAWARFSQILPWTHSWDAVDAAFYTPSAGEQTEYGVTSTPRVASIADPSGGKPLLRDSGVFGTAFTHPTQPLPGPQYIASSARFRRPAVKFDQVDASPLLYATLSPQTTINSSSDFFFPPNGFTPPYWGALLVRLAATPGGAVDSILGSDRTISAGPTVGYGNQVGSGSDWSFACWYDPVSDDPTGIIPDGTVRSGHTQSADETVLLIPVMAEGTNASSMYVIWRDASRIVRTDLATGTVSTNAPSMAWRDLFFGLVDDHSYLSAAGIQDGPFDAGDLSALLAWVEPWLVPTGALASEP